MTKPKAKKPIVGNLAKSAAKTNKPGAGKPLALPLVPELRWVKAKPNSHSHSVKVKAIATVLRNRIEAFLNKPVKDLKPSELNLIRMILEW